MITLENQQQEREWERNEKIVQHALRYRVTISAVVTKRFFGTHLVADRAEAERQAREVLDELVAEKRLVKRPGKGVVARECYFPNDSTLKEATLDFDLATLWFCHMRQQRRYRVLHKQFADMFEEPEKAPYHNNHFALVDEEGAPVLLRVYHCASEIADAKKSVERYIKDAKSKSRSWQEDGTLGLALLPATDVKRDALRKYIGAKSQKLGAKPIERMRIVVETAPNKHTLGKMLKSL